MHKVISVTACSLLMAFAPAGYGQSMQGASQPGAKDALGSSPENAGSHTNAHQKKPNERSTDSDSRSNAQSRKNSVEAGDGRSTATSSGGASKDARDGDPDGGRSPNGGRVVHPNEP